MINSQLTLNQSFNRAIWILATSFIMILILVTGASLFINDREFHDRSDLLSKAAANSILLGDYRQVVSLLDPTIGYSLDRIELNISDNQKILSIPAQSVPETLFSTRKSVRISSSTQPFNAPVAQLDFYYNYSHALLWPLVLGVFLALVAAPLFYKIKNNLELKHAESLDYQRAQIISEIATQVAHDIRSPLSALKIIGSRIENLGLRETKLLLKSANRIEEIANDLLARNHSYEVYVTNKAEKNRPNLLISAIEEVVSEAVLVHEKANIQIRMTFEPEMADIPAPINSSELMRVMSNLISNAIEAIQAKSKNGSVSVDLVRLNGRSQIKISDDGIGIPPDRIAVLGQKSGTTFGKKFLGSGSGSGLGLAHAFRFVKSVGGEIRIESKINVGTDIIISLPASAS